MFVFRCLKLQSFFCFCSKRTYLKVETGKTLCQLQWLAGKWSCYFNRRGKLFFWCKKYESGVKILGSTFFLCSFHPNWENKTFFFRVHNSSCSVAFSSFSFTVVWIGTLRVEHIFFQTDHMFLITGKMAKYFEYCGALLFFCHFNVNPALCHGPRSSHKSTTYEDLM